MKKLVNVLSKTVVAAGVLGLAIASGVACAEDIKGYVGAGLDYSTYGTNKNIKGFSNKSVKTSGMGVLVPVLGVKFTENFGLEAGYSFNKKQKEEGIVNNLVINGVTLNGTSSFTTKVRNIYLDVMGFMPVHEQVELLGGIGIGRLTVKKGNESTSYTAVGGAVPSSTSPTFKNKASWRVKVGAQYNITANVAARLLATYQKANNKVNILGTESKFVKNMKTIGLSATYTF